MYGQNDAKILKVGQVDRALANGWLTRHESGAYLRFTEAGAALFA